jgi:octopine/nopaline transport system substrate-binding protein
MRMLYAVIAILSLLTLQMPAQAQSRKAISIAAEGASPPWSGTNDNGELYGFDIDLGKDLCRRIERECKFVAQDWDGIIPALTVGKFDVIISGMSITEKRKKSIAFTIPYAGGFNQFVMRKDLSLGSGGREEKLNLSMSGKREADLIAGLKTALSGKAIGVLRSSNSEAVLKELFGNGITLRSYDSQDNLQLDLTSGRIDGGLADYFTWRDFLKTPEGAVADFFGPELSGGLWGPGVGAGIRKDDTALLAEFDNAIKAATADGTIRSLSIKWFDADISPSQVN